MLDVQSQWAELLLSSLVEAGVKCAVISPGSRSTPLVWAALRTPGLSCYSAIDERSAGFFALGQARISGLPSVLICTSGTAVSNYYPAVIEARESGLPLIVLSADRPFQLAHAGAHQTIDQTRLFGTYAWYHELGTPVADQSALLGLRRIAWQAMDTALTPPRGAVHLNFRAQKPLEPRPGAKRIEIPEVPPRVRPPSVRGSNLEPAELAWLAEALETSECPLLICGALSIQEAPAVETVTRFAERSGAIVCVESVGQLRFKLGAALGDRFVVCDTYDWLLEDSALRSRLHPDFVLQLGGAPVSAALSRVLEEGLGQLRYAICALSGWPDALHQGAQIVRAAPGPLLEAMNLLLDHRPRPSRPRIELWRSAQRLAHEAIAAHLSAFGEASAAALVCQSLPPGSVLAVGNSLPPRLMDRYCQSSGLGIDVCAQRGASGIEGAIAGALGAASQGRRATTLLVGDISFLHDVGSLWLARSVHALGPEASCPVVIVVLNNAGGRIFEALPIAGQSEVDLRYWTTPHALGLRGAAELYGIEFARAENEPELRAALAAGYSRDGVTLVEVAVDPSSAAGSLERVRAALAPVFLRVASPG